MRRLLAASITALVVGISPALADKGGRHDDDRETVERARDQGKVLPLAEILDILKTRGLTGKVVEVELEDDDEGLIYEIYLLGPDGRRREIKVDPTSGRIIDVDHD